MDPSLWATEHVPQWVRRSRREFSSPEPGALLGEDDADTEWNSGTRPVSVFVHTPTYENVKRVEVLYLFGRRGTGKTAVFRMLQHEVREGLLHDISHCWIIQSDRVKIELQDLLSHSHLAPLNSHGLVNICRGLWFWLFQVAAMLAVVNSEPVPDSHVEDVNELKKYLTFADSSYHIDRGDLTRAVAQRAASHLRDALQKAESAQAVFRQLSDELHNLAFQTAERALRRILKTSRHLCVVAIDAGEVYEVADPVTVALMDGLIDAVRVSYKDREISKVVGKAAFPAEIIEYLHPQNHDKFRNHSTSISWRYDDLLLFIAKRYHQLIGERVPTEAVSNIESVADAEEWLYRMVPRRITSRCGFGVDTLAYIIRHTQKKPRQLLHLFNSILSLAEHNRVSAHQLYKYPEHIVDGVQMGLDVLIDGVLGVYEMIIPGAPKIIRAAVANSEAWWPGSELGQVVRKASGVRGKALSADDLRDLLFEAGVLGKARTVASFGHGADGRPTYLMTATFQYQVRTAAPPSPEDVFVIHPMLYEGFEIFVDKRVYVYPTPLETGEEAVLRRLGIALAED